jgi:hypothetical protein
MPITIVAAEHRLRPPDDARVTSQPGSESDQDLLVLAFRRLATIEDRAGVAGRAESTSALFSSDTIVGNGLRGKQPKL